MVSISEQVNNFLSDINPRQRDIIEGRFGLKGDKYTLAELGEKYDLTRERVRQIEASGLSLINEKFIKSPAIKIFDKSINHIENFGGVRKEDQFLDDFRALTNDNKVDNSHIRLIFEVAKKPYYYNNDEHYHNFWYLHPEALKQSEVFINKFAKFIADKKRELIHENKFNDVYSQFIKQYGVKHPVGLNYISISKKFGNNSFGDFGLSDWEEISPKTARAKTYLILKKHGEPLHFRDIAQKINGLDFGKKVIYQTIHNELIKDPRFVLVGRGFYGLKEHGHESGTARDIIVSILKKNGPMRKEDIVKEVVKKRFLKENTILINVQSRKYFKRLEDGKYYMA